MCRLDLLCTQIIKKLRWYGRRYNRRLGERVTWLSNSMRSDPRASMRIHHTHTDDRSVPYFDGNRSSSKDPEPAPDQPAYNMITEPTRDWDRRSRFISTRWIVPLRGSIWCCSSISKQQYAQDNYEAPAPATDLVSPAVSTPARLCFYLCFCLFFW